MARGNFALLCRFAGRHLNISVKDVSPPQSEVFHLKSHLGLSQQNSPKTINIQENIWRFITETCM